MAADREILDDGSPLVQAESTERRAFDEAEIEPENQEEATARREFTETLAKERQLASGQFPPIKSPTSEDVQELMHPPPPPPPPPLPKWPEGDRLRVLVVQDDQAAAAKLCQQLDQAGHAALHVGGGEEIVTTCEQLSPQLVLLCVEISPRSGYVICNQLKQHEELRNVPLILMSAEATVETFRQHRKLATRADDYQLLPIVAQELQTKIARVTSPGAAQKRASAPEEGGGFPIWVLLLGALVVLGAMVGTVIFLVS